MHGHNYTVGVRLVGSRKIANDGYVVDFGNIKKVTRKICKGLNEHFLVPTLSDVMDISVSEENGYKSVRLSCQDGSYFIFPQSDCAMLPIVHATTEELGIYLWSRILEALSSQYLIDRGIHTMEVTVNEAVGQEAIFRHEIPKVLEETSILDVRAFIMEGEVKPMPCPSAPTTASPTTSPQPASNTSSTTNGSDCMDGKCDSCLRGKLQKLADAISQMTNTESITVQELEKIVLTDN